MPLQLLPMEESDIDAATRIAFAAFGPDLMQILYPNGWTDADIAHSAKDNLSGWRKHKDSMIYTKVIDTDLPSDHENNQIVGTAKWRIYSDTRTEAQLDKEIEDALSPNHPSPPSADKKALDVFFGAILRARRNRMGGKPYVLLSVIATHPHHHRRGVGAMHLEHGLAKTDGLGMPAFLEATPNGKPLYERYGWEAIGELDFDAKAWGLGRDLVHALMLRPAKGT